MRTAPCQGLSIDAAPELDAQGWFADAILSPQSYAPRPASDRPLTHPKSRAAADWWELRGQFGEQFAGKLQYQRHGNQFVVGNRDPYVIEHWSQLKPRQIRRTGLATTQHAIDCFLQTMPGRLLPVAEHDAERSPVGEVSSAVLGLDEQPAASPKRRRWIARVERFQAEGHPDRE